MHESYFDKWAEQGFFENKCKFLESRAFRNRKPRICSDEPLIFNSNVAGGLDASDAPAELKNSLIYLHSWGGTPEEVLPMIPFLTGRFTRNMCLGKTECPPSAFSRNKLDCVNRKELDKSVSLHDKEGLIKAMETAVGPSVRMDHDLDRRLGEKYDWQNIGVFKKKRKLVDLLDFPLRQAAYPWHDNNQTVSEPSILDFKVIAPAASLLNVWYEKPRSDPINGWFDYNKNEIHMSGYYDFENSRRRLLGLIDYEIQRMKRTGGKIVICGFSQGASVALDILLMLPREWHPFIGGVVACRGWPEIKSFRDYIQTFGDSATPGAPPVLLTFTSADDMMPLPIAIRRFRFLYDYGFDFQVYLFPKLRHSEDYPFELVETSDFIKRVLSI